MSAQQQRPWLFLDFDGVLNRFGGDEQLALHDQDPDVYNDWVAHHDVKPVGHPSPGYTLQVSPTLVSELCELHHLFEVLWLTTWEDAAQAVLAPLFELPAWETCGRPKFSGPVKALRVETHLEANPRPWAWVDDDEADPNRGYLPHSDIFDLPHLLIQPESDRGLDRRHIRKLRTFAAEHAASQ